MQVLDRAIFNPNALAGRQSVVRINLSRREVVVGIGEDGDLIAAKRVVAFGSAVGGFHHMEIVRMAAVIEDYFLVEVAKFRHGNKISRKAGTSTCCGLTCSTASA